MEPVTIVLAVVAGLAVLAVFTLIVRGRGGGVSSIDPEALRRLVAEAVAGTAAAPGTATTDPAGARGRHQAGTPDSAHDNGTDGAHDSATDTSEHIRATRDAADLDKARAQAQKLTENGRAQAERIVAEARAEAAEIRAALDRERRDATEDVDQALATERATLRDERDELAAATAVLRDDRAALTADRERLRADRADLARAREDLSAREQILRDGTARLGEAQAALDEARSTQRREAETARHEQEQELARVAGLTAEAARTELLARQEEQTRHDAAVMIRRVESEAQATAQTRARAIVADAIQRVASDQTAQSVVTVIQLPSDDVKGRIIGREGRNIRTFETVTGVNVIIDDTPEAVLLSCFDPVRREIGRVALQSLIDDGRIHPHRIEEAYERAQDEVTALCQRAAEDALLEVGIADLHPELVSLVGQLKYRTSYGQNVLAHCVETAHIARLMAAELGIDPGIVTRGAFLHDIGKALTHEAQGSHAIVGADIARRHGEDSEVVHCIEAHHDEVPPSSIEAVLTQAADACSGGRPGARRESLESYVKRLEHIEAIANAKKGVDKVFAMQAGRELRVMVKPDAVDDLEAHVMAREVAKQIEEELTYPGQVRVTVIRESRATEVAR